MAKKKGLGPRGLKIQAWIDARKRHNLGHAHVQMARELGLNPAKLGKIDNHDQQPWKAPLPVFIENLYERRFGKRCPDVVKRAEDGIAALNRKKDDHRARKRAAKRVAESPRVAEMTPSSPVAGEATISRSVHPDIVANFDEVAAITRTDNSESPKAVNLYAVDSPDDARQLSMFDDCGDR